MNLDIDLGLAPASESGLSRRPDLIVLNEDEVERVDAKGGIPRCGWWWRSSCPTRSGSITWTKRRDYADAGIPVEINLDRLRS